MQVTEWPLKLTLLQENRVPWLNDGLVSEVVPNVATLPYLPSLDEASDCMLVRLEVRKLEVFDGKTIIAHIRVLALENHVMLKADGFSLARTKSSVYGDLSECIVGLICLLLWLWL